MSLPSFFIIGAMKCATSSLQAQLAAQEGVFMCSPKEPNFFSDDDVFARGLGWYEGLFADAPEGSLLGEASTHYTKLPTYPETLDRLSTAIEAPKFIYVMRHPIERIESHYIHEWSRNEIKAPIKEAVFSQTRLIDYSRYNMQITPYLDRYGSENVLPVFLPRLKHAPEAELNRIGAFLGLEAHLTWRSDLADSNVSKERIRRFPLDRLLIESKPAAFLRRTFVPKGLREAIKSRLQMRQRPHLEGAALDHATTLLDEDLAALGKRLGISLTCANFNAAVIEGADWIKMK